MQTTQRSIINLFKVMFSILLFVGATAAWAQQPVNEPPQPVEEFPKPHEQQPPAEELPPTSQYNVRDDFTDEELQKFVRANEKIVQLQMESEKRMIGAIEGEGLTVDRFNEILQAVQVQDKSQANASPEELSSFNNAANAIIQERQKTEHEMVTSVEQEGIDVDTFHEIMIAYEQNAKVKKKINKLLDENGN